MARSLFYTIIGITFLSGLTYVVNLGLSTFLQDDWWRGFWSAMFFAFMSNLFNAIGRAMQEDDDMSPGVTEMATEEDDALSSYLDRRRAVDPSPWSHRRHK